MTEITTIHVPVLARVEGEGALELSIHDNKIVDLKLRIYEPPRMFEKFLEGRRYSEVPDIVARICGICPVAYQMSAVQAIESAFEFEPSPWIRAMRRALYCGEWLQSHALHIHLLAMPDFLGYHSVLELAKDYPEQVRRGMRLQGLGNRLMRMFGGRSVHPVGVRVGGFHAAPAEAEVAALHVALIAAVADAEALLQWVAGIAVPQDYQNFTCVALSNTDHYPILEGRLCSNRGLNIPIDRYETCFQEYQVPHSNALHSRLCAEMDNNGGAGEAYLVGPLARVNLNADKLPERLRAFLKSNGVPFPSRNMFDSLYARAVEIYFSVVEAARLLENYQRPESPWLPVQTRANIGYGCTEAPRGLLWHSYEMDQHGTIIKAKIVPPTSQNQARIEEDLQQALTAFGLDRGHDELRRHGEMVIRNYDPCISCSTHFLRLDVNRL